MSKFNFNILKTKNYISNVKAKLNEYKETMTTYLSNNINVDSVWNDYNTNAFIETVKKEKTDFFEYDKSFSKYIETINSFCESLSTIIKNNISVESVKSIEYDYDKINVLINKLDLCAKKMNENYLILDRVQIPISFKYYFVLYKYKSNFIVYRDEFLNLKTKLNNIKNSIESLIQRTKYSVNSFDVKYVNSKVMSHNYKINNINVSNKLSSSKFKTVKAESNNVEVTLKDNNKKISQTTSVSTQNIKEANLIEKTAEVNLNEYKALNNQVNYKLDERKLDPNIENIPGVNQKLEEVNLMENSTEVNLNEYNALDNKLDVNLSNSELKSNINNEMVGGANIQNLNLGQNNINNVNSKNATNNIII